MTTTKQQLLTALTSRGETPADIITCFYQDQEGYVPMWVDEVPTIRQCTFDELPEREFHAGYGATEGEPCVAFSDLYVYIKVKYDGAEWFDAIPRHPAAVTFIPWVGG